MPYYTYTAYRESGDLYRSHIEAQTLEEAKQNLAHQGILTIQLKVKRINFFKSISSKDLCEFTSQLKQLSKARIPLLKSLELMHAQWKQKPMGSLILSLIHSLQKGLSFSSALSCFPQYFSPFYVHMIDMASQSGTFIQTLEYLEQAQTKKYTIRKKIISKLSYPLFIFLSSIALFEVLILGLLPQLKELFEAQNPSSLTSFIFSFSEHIKHHQIIYLSFMFIGLLGAYICWKFEIIKQKVDFFCIHNPALQLLFIPFYFYHISSTLSLLLQSNIPLKKSLQLTQKTLSNRYLQTIFEDIQKNLITGQPLSECLRGYSFVPSLFQHLVEIAETTGDFTTSFDQLSSFFEDLFQKRLHQFTALLSPLLLFMMGALIALLALGILLPLTDVQSLNF